MAHVGLLFLSLFIYSCIGAGIGTFDEITNICLYSGDQSKVLRPLQIRNVNCPGQTANCMNAIYKYSNWQYNGVAALKPALGEVFSYLTQDQQGKIDLVVIMNANVKITSKVYVEITGAEPTPILLYDDPAPSDTWIWANNKGNFSWATQPGYTDGVIIGHIKFVDNYCVRMSFQQTAGALSKVSIISGNITHVQKVHSVPYVSGQFFEYCQYPVTGQVQKDATCPGATDGSASIWMIFGPSAVDYSWYTSNGVLVSTTPNATNLAAGSYRVFVTDPSTNGCSIDRTITIRDHALTGAPVSTTPFACVTKGTATVTPAGGSGGFTYQWFRVGSATPIGTASSITGLDQGNYYVIVTDSCGSQITTNFNIATTGCCGDGICQAARGEQCASSNYCAVDCGICCPPGTYINGEACTVCPAGTRSNIYQATSCSDCPANTFNAGGNDTCVDCPENYRSAAGSGKCVRCPLGQVRASDASSCSECGQGQYAPPCGSSGCVDCQAGTFASEAGSTSCKTCPAGTFSATKAPGCTPCAENYYSSSKSSACTKCPEGTTTVDVGTHLLSCN